MSIRRRLKKAKKRAGENPGESLADWAIGAVSRAMEQTGVSFASAEQAVAGVLLNSAADMLSYHPCFAEQTLEIRRLASEVQKAACEASDRPEAGGN